MAYKTFANGFPLPASDLNNYLMNQSVIVFANSTARDAALTSPIEGMVTYLEDTDSLELWTGASWDVVNDNTASIPKSTVTTAGDLIVADGASSVTRLGVGSAGTVLSSDGTDVSWATPSSGGLNQIGTGSFSGSTVNITSIPSGYKFLSLYAYDVQTTDGAQLKCTFNSDTSPIYTTGSTSVFCAPTGGTLGSAAKRQMWLDLRNYDSGSNGVTMEVENGVLETGAPYYGSANANYYYGGNTVTSWQIFSATASSFTGGTWILYGAN